MKDLIRCITPKGEVLRNCYLDFEFNGTAERDLNLVSVAVNCFETTDKATTHTYTRTYWLHSKGKRTEAQRFFKHLVETGHNFVAYVMEAEARSLLSLFNGEDILKNTGVIDLYLEYRCLLNHNHEFAYGKQYIEGKVIKTTPPKNKWELVEKDDESEGHHKPSFSLAAAVYKMLGVEIDTEEKNRVRDIIIRSNREEIESSREDILKYNASDIKHLPALLAAIYSTMMREGIYASEDDWAKAAAMRGDYAVRTARMIRTGYPVNMDKVNAFTSNIPLILKSAAEACLEISPEVGAFRLDKKTKRYVACEKNIRDWVETQKMPYWRKTEKGKVSISKDAFSDWFDSTSDGFAGAFCRYLKTKQSLNGFLPGNGKKGVFKNYVGSDNRVRPHFGIYGSQSSRSQPAATGFIPLKAHWMRNFIEAKPGRALAGVDYASQEFLIAAIVSQDFKMMEAYESGDVYLAFGKEAGLIPPEGTKESHKKMRDICKTLVLGISYDMSARGLAPRLTKIAGEVFSEERAQELIEKFYDTYSDYAYWKKETLKEYKTSQQLSLPDGWVMSGDNDNIRSVGNFPIQGHGAVIMREAVRKAQDVGLDVIYTLHDALYIEFPHLDGYSIRKLMQSMAAAFEEVMAPYGKTVPIRLEGEAWSSEYDFYDASHPKPIPNIHFLKEYVDAKGEADLERYRQYFTVPNLQGDMHHGFSKSVISPEVLQVRGVFKRAETSVGGNL